MKKFTYKEMNEFTYNFNQWPLENTDRIDLLNLIIKSSGYDKNISAQLCGSDCYRITALQNLLFSGKSKVSILELSEYVYKKLFFIWSLEYPKYPGSFQMMSTAGIYRAMSSSGLIEEYSYRDCDYGTKPEQRQKCFDELVARMLEPDFVSARVCFDNGSAHGHAIMVCNNDEGKPVVIDNSSRPHQWPGNDMFQHVTPQNIKWWTCIS